MTFNLIPPFIYSPHKTSPGEGLQISECSFLFSFFIYTVKARVRANTQNIQQGEQETSGVGEGRTKQCVTETRDRWKGEGWGGVHRVNNLDTTGTFRKESREFEGGVFGVD